MGSEVDDNAFPMPNYFRSLLEQFRSLQLVFSESCIGKVN